MGRLAPFLLQLVVFTLTLEACLAQCPQVCRFSRTQAINECQNPQCEVDRCSLFGDFIPEDIISVNGFRCMPKPSPSPSSTPSATSTPSPSPSVSPSSTASVSATPSSTPSATPTPSPSPSVSPSSTASVSATPSSTPSATPTPSPSPSASPSSTPSAAVTQSITPTPSPTPTKLGSGCGRAYWDPHIRTYDGLYYRCMAKGEVILATSQGVETTFEVQARFVEVQGLPEYSTIAGVVISQTARPRIQISIPTKPGGVRTQVEAYNMITPFGTTASGTRTCDIFFYVNGVQKQLQPGLQTFLEVEVRLMGDLITVKMFGMELNVWVGYYDSFSMGCILQTTQVCPKNREGESIIGLLGSSNGNREDDWMKRNGAQVPLPPPEELDWRETQPDSYAYCTREWCMTDEKESLFDYEPGTSFDTFAKCAEPFAGRRRAISRQLHVEEFPACNGRPDCNLEASVAGPAVISRFLEDMERVRRVEEDFVLNRKNVADNEEVLTCPDACRKSKKLAFRDCSLLSDPDLCIVKECEKGTGGRRQGFSCSPKTLPGAILSDIPIFIDIPTPGFLF